MPGGVADDNVAAVVRGRGKGQVVKIVAAGFIAKNRGTGQIDARQVGRGLGQEVLLHLFGEQHILLEAQSLGQLGGHGIKRLGQPPQFVAADYRGSCVQIALGQPGGGQG